LSVASTCITTNPLATSSFIVVLKKAKCSQTKNTAISKLNQRKNNKFTQIENDSGMDIHLTLKTKQKINTDNMNFIVLNIPKCFIITLLLIFTKIGVKNGCSRVTIFLEHWSIVVDTG
jgi:hypothetical protein